MDLKQLTAKQLKVLNYMKDYKSENGILPTYNKMRHYMGNKSDHSITQHIQALLKKGYLEKENGKYTIVDFHMQQIIERVQESLDNNWAVEAEDIQALINHIEQ